MSTSLFLHWRSPGQLLPSIKELRYSLVIVFLMCLGFPTPAKAIDSVTLVEKLQATYEKATTLVADFSQTTSMKFSQRIRQGSGTMVFRKPGRMRWDYLAPDYQVLISDGESISMYFEKNKQMIISNAKDYLQSDVTYAFFSGTGNILNDFDIAEPDIANNLPDSHLVKLVPKSAHPQVSSMLAWISDKTFLIEHLQIIDHFDTVTDLFFANIKIDSTLYGDRPINDDLFFFMPPADTEIIEQN